MARFLPVGWRSRVSCFNWGLLILLIAYSMLSPTSGGLFSSEETEAIIGGIVFGLAGAANLALLAFARPRKLGSAIVGTVWAVLCFLTLYYSSDYHWSRVLQGGKDEYDREHAALVLLAGESTGYLPLVHRTLHEDPSPEARYWIAHRLMTFRPQDYGVLLQAYQSEVHWMVREQLLDELARVYARDPERIVPLLMSALTDADGGVRCSAQRRLELIAEDLHTAAPETPGAFELEEGIESQRIWEKWWNDLQAREAARVTAP